MSEQSDPRSEDGVKLPEFLREFFKNEFKVRPGEKFVRLSESPENFDSSCAELRQAYIDAGIPYQELTFHVPRLVEGPNGPQFEFVEVRAVGPADACDQKPI